MFPQRPQVICGAGGRLGSAGERAAERLGGAGIAGHFTIGKAWENGGFFMGFMTGWW